MCQHAQSNACLDLPARVRPPARWRAPGSASKGLIGGGSAQTADCRHQSAACDGDGGSYGCGHRPAKRAVATAATAATPTVTPGGGGDFGRRGRRPVKRASAAAVTAAAAVAGPAVGGAGRRAVAAVPQRRRSRARR